jgi:hypothetical protein
MSRKEIARRLVAEKSILDALQDANQETRDLAREEYEPGDADSVMVDGETFGRVRRDKPIQKLRVVDFGLVYKFAEQHAPHAIVPNLDRGFLSAITKSGTWIDRETGEVLEVPGVVLQEMPGNLVVTTTDTADEWARQVLGKALPELEG